jgi:hypothetical protein
MDKIVHYTPPTQKITDKNEIIGYAKKYLKQNSIIDIRWFIYNDMKYNDAPESFIRDVAYQMVGTGHFQMEYTDYQVHFLVTKKHWVFARPFTYAVIVALVSGFISILVGLLTNRADNQVQFLKDSQQDSLIQDLKQKSNSVPNDTTFRPKKLQDVLPKTKNN